MLTLHVPAMSCGGCLRNVTAALRAADPLVRIEADLESRTVNVATSRSNAALLDALRGAGYPAEPVLGPVLDPLG